MRPPQRFTLRVNNQEKTVNVSPDMPLLWVLREELGLPGTKFGCGIARCGACTVQIDEVPKRSCVLPIGDLRGENITTIEGAAGRESLRRVQEAWIANQVPQCGYCQSGQILAAEALLRANPNPTESDVDLALSGNLCRCGTYPRIKKTILELGGQQSGRGS